MASNASLLNRCRSVMTDLHPFAVPEKLSNLFFDQSRVTRGQFSETSQFFVTNVVSVLLREQVFIYPEPPTFRDDDRAVSILPEAFLEDSAAQVIHLAQLYLPDRRTEFIIR